MNFEQNPDFTLSAYDYHLPEDRIAQTPVMPRDQSKLLVVTSGSEHQHQHFYDLPNWLKSGDLLVLNDTRVLPARLYGYKSTGAVVEVLLLEERQPNHWLALVKPGRRLKPGSEIFFKPHTEGETRQLKATIIASDTQTNGRILQFEVSTGEFLIQVLEHFGHVPFPPYITATQATPEQYQTVYADRSGSVAAPTAGLHFTPELLARLQKMGINQAKLTLHVGVGTFRPVEAENILAHQMHGEWIDVNAETVAKIRQTQAANGRVIAVGTTVVRALEGAAQEGDLKPFCGKTELFIYPGYRWRVVEGLITNFHLPKSSLMMLVSALIGRKRLLDLYQEAIAHQYRFYSFGDAMLIVPEARMS